MRLPHIVLFSMLLAALLPLAFVISQTSEHATITSPADVLSLPTAEFRRRDIVYGLPQGWTAVFQRVASIQPPLISSAFIQFFSMAAKAAAEDPIPGRHVQRIPFGSLVLEFIANGDQSQLVTREFVEAASLWLLDLTQKGWTGFFRAWVLDRADGDLVFVRLTTMWDEMMSGTLLN